jgi:uncharacterized membrane protein YdjX (TVP38/TMEM64 family)
MAAEDLPDRRGRLTAALRRFGPLLLVAAVVVAAFASGVTRHLSLHELRVHRAALAALVRAHPVASLCVYTGAYALLVALSLPVALIMTLTGGLLFGPWLGGLAAAIGCTTGATIVFLICRTAIGDLLKRRAGPTAARIEAGVRRDAFSYIVMLRLVPVAPFWLANLALSFIDIPLTTFATASLIGILPVSLIYAGLGSELNTLFAAGVRPDPHLILRPQILAPLIGLALLALAPVAIRRWRGRRRG